MAFDRLVKFQGQEGVVKYIPEAWSAAGSLRTALCYSSLYGGVVSDHYCCSVAEVFLAEFVKVTWTVEVSKA
jgi:hypothetical protein